MDKDGLCEAYKLLFAHIEEVVGTVILENGE